MEREVFIVLNISTNEIEIKDFGLLLPTDVSIDLSDFDESFLSEEIDQYLQNGDLVRLINGASVGYNESFDQNLPLLNSYLLESSLGAQFYFQDGSLYIIDSSGVNYEGGTNISIDSSNKIILDSSLKEIESISFDPSLNPSNISSSIGTLYYNSDIQALSVKAIGNQEFVPEEGVAVYVYNNNSYTIPKGRAIYVSGQFNGRPEVEFTPGTSQFATVSGISVTDIDPSSFGWMQTFGIARFLDTTSYEPGDVLRLSPEPSGFLTDTTPSAPNPIIFIGTVTKKDASYGEIFLHIKTGQNLSLLPDVNARLTQTDNQLLAWDASNSYWNNIDLSTLGETVGLALQSLVDASNAVQDGRLLLLESSVNVLWTLPQIYATTAYVDGSLAARDASITNIYNTAVFESSLGDTLYWNSGELDVSTSFVNSASSIGLGQDLFSEISNGNLLLKTLDGSNGLLVRTDGSTLSVDSSIYVPGSFTYTGTPYQGNLDFHIPFLYKNTQLLGKRLGNVTSFNSASGVTQIADKDVSVEDFGEFFPWGTSTWDSSTLSGSTLILTDWRIFYQEAREVIKSSFTIDVSALGLGNGPWAVYAVYNGGDPSISLEQFLDREAYPDKAYLGHVGVENGQIKVWHESPDLFGTDPLTRDRASYGVGDKREGMDLYIVDASNLGITEGHYLNEGASFRDWDFYNDIFVGSPNENPIPASTQLVFQETDPSGGFRDLAIPNYTDLRTYSNRYYDVSSGTYIDSSANGKYVLASIYIVDENKVRINRGPLYDTIDDAFDNISNFGNISPELNTIITKIHPLLGYIIIQTDVSTLENEDQFRLIEVATSSLSSGGGGGGGLIDGAINLGGGANVYSQTVSKILQFRSLASTDTGLLSISQGTDEISFTPFDFDPSISQAFGNIETLKNDIDASFASERNYVNSTFISETSLGGDFVWNSGLLEVSIAADVTKAYVDGSLAERDASITFIYNNGLGFLQESSLNYNTFFFDSSSLLDISVGKYETKKFLAGKATTQVLGTSYADVTGWDLALINTSTIADPYYTWDETNGILTFDKAGWYEINVQMNTDVLSGGTRANTAFKVLEDTGSGYVDIPYSETWMYNRTVGQGADNGSFFTLRQYSDGDTLKIQALEDGGDNQITSAQISVIKSEIGASLTIFDVSGGVSQLYVDGSLLQRDASIELIFNNGLEFLKESSLGVGFVFNDVTDVYDVSITGAVGLYAWARTTDAGALVDAYGLTVSRTGTGVYQYTFNFPLTNANYGIIGQPFGTVQDTNCQVANVTNTGFELTFGSGDNGTSPDVPVDAEHSVMVLGPPTEVGLGVSRDYVDGSLAQRDSSIEFIFENGLSFVKEASLGNKFFFDSSGFLDVSIGTTGDVSKVYVDGSLALRDASIEILFIENDIQDASIVGLKNRTDVIDGSIIFIDSSINQLFSQKADLTYVDGSINQLRIDVDSSFQSIQSGLVEYLSPIDGTSSDVSSLIEYADRQLAFGQPIYLHDPSDLGFVFDNLTTGNNYNSLPWFGINGGGSAPRLKLSGTSNVLSTVGIRGVELFITDGADVTLSGFSEHARVDLSEIRFQIGATRPKLSLNAVNVTTGRIEGQSADAILVIKDRTQLQVQNINEVADVYVEGGGILQANWTRLNTDIHMGLSDASVSGTGALVTIARGYSPGKIDVWGDYGVLTVEDIDIEVRAGATSNTIIGSNNTITDNGNGTIIVEDILGKLNESSLGPSFIWSGGLVDVSISGASQSYVDGSLALRDASISSNTVAIQNLDSSLDLYVLKSGDTITGSLGITGDASIGGSLYLGDDSSIGTDLPFAQIDVNNGNKIVNKSNYYGQEFQQGSSLGVSSSNSTTPVTKLTLTTSDLPTGDYKAVVHWMWNRNTASNSARFDIQLNGSTEGTTGTIEMEAQDPTNWHPETRIFYFSLSGINDISLRYWGETTGSTTSISDATIELIRVS